jgi:hypothetical protein
MPANTGESFTARLPAKLYHKSSYSFAGSSAANTGVEQMAYKSGNDSQEEVKRMKQDSADKS